MKLKDYQTIIDLCDEIQEKTPYCVFFDFSGHIYTGCINIAASKEDYTSKIYNTSFNGKSIKCIEDDLKEILEDGLTSLSLVVKANEVSIKKAFESQCLLGVSKRRSIANIAKEFELTQKQIKTIIGL